MDIDPEPQPRKVKFPPKKPLSRGKNRPAQPLVIHDEAMDEVEVRSRERLLRKVNERLGTEVRPKSENPPARVAFQIDSTELKTFNKAKHGTSDQVTKNLTDEAHEVTKTPKKLYKEPWDYEHSYYPITLPLRKPNSGDPELLNAQEFGEAAQEKMFDENSENHAISLGLHERSNEPRMIRFQFPNFLPILMDGKTSKKVCSLEDLPKGQMGKMLVYKSGAVKLKLGDFVYDVSSSGGVCPEDAVAMNDSCGDCSKLGEVEKRAVVVPDVDSLLAFDDL